MLTVMQMIGRGRATRSTLNVSDSLVEKKYFKWSVYLLDKNVNMLQTCKDAIAI
jgi:hypothetical protein